MKKRSALTLLVLLIPALTFAQTKGPAADRILFDVRLQEDIGLKDVAEGKTDLFDYGVGANTLKALPDDVKAKLDVYGVPSGSWSLLTNPFPNQAPYTAQVGGKTVFNPFAIREVRYALNFLINRQQLVDEILAGGGIPVFTPATPGQPNASRYDSVAQKQGFTARGNEKKALADIASALEAAAALPENKGRLVKASPFWTFDGQPVTVKFLIRVDDPNGRLKEGRTIADQIEKAGIKVERLEWDRKKCIGLAYQENPANLDWHLYTEAWSGGQTYAFWDVSMAQMYAPWYSNMPGSNTEGFWSYLNPDIDNLTQDAVNGRFADEAEYYAKLIKATEIGTKEAVRIYLVAQEQYYAANKARFNSRMIYGVGDGLNKYSYLTADVKPGTDGKKTVKVTLFSARGSLFSAAWDPIGTDGFNDTYSTAMARPLTDYEGDPNPLTGLYVEGRTAFKNVSTKVKPDAKGNLVGQIAVPADAKIWNAKTRKWESGLTYADVKGDGSEYDYQKGAAVTAFSTGTYTYKGGNWHSGRPIVASDFLYSAALGYDLSVKKGEGDKLYDENYAGTANPNLIRSKGLVLNKDGSITTYFDVNFPMDKAYLATQGAPSLNLQPVTQGVFVSWEIAEALVKLVTDGGASKTNWSFGSSDSVTEVDVLNPKCVADIQAKLKEFIAAKHVPDCLAGYVTPEEAVKNYTGALAFVTKYGHAYLSNGAFILEKFDPANNSAVEVANRDAAYPYPVGFYSKLFAGELARVDSVKLSPYQKAKDVTVTVAVSTVAFPSGTAKAAPKAQVKVTLTGAAEKAYPAKADAKAGSFTVTIPAKDLAALKAGSYPVVVEAALGQESPAVETANLLVF